MDNLWQKIPLSDYENHMSLGSVGQLQAMNRLLLPQFGNYAAGGSRRERSGAY